MKNDPAEVSRLAELFRNVPPGDVLVQGYWLAEKLLEINRCWPVWAVLSRAHHMVFTFSTMSNFYRHLHRTSVKNEFGSALPKWHETYDVFLGLAAGLDRSHHKMCLGAGPTIEGWQKVGDETARVPSISLIYAGFRMRGDLALPSYGTLVRELNRLRLEIRKTAAALCSVDRRLEIVLKHERRIKSIERDGAYIASRSGLPLSRVHALGRYFPIGFDECMTIE